jgi:hypothetical protein
MGDRHNSTVSGEGSQQLLTSGFAAAISDLGLTEGTGLVQHQVSKCRHTLIGVLPFGVVNVGIAHPLQHQCIA